MPNLREKNRMRPPRINSLFRDSGHFTHMIIPGGGGGIHPYTRTRVGRSGLFIIFLLFFILVIAMYMIVHTCTIVHIE